MLRVYLSFCQKDNINLPQPDDKQILLTLRHLQHTQLKHAKSSHKTQTALGFWKDVGQLKNGNGWQFVGDGGSLTVWFIHQKCLWYSRRVPVSVYTTVNESIQQHTAVRYNSWLRWTPMKLRLQQTVTHFHSSAVRRPFRSQVQFVSCGCFLRVFSWVCWRCMRFGRILYLSSSWGILILSFWENDKRTLNILVPEFPFNFSTLCI